ncbi:uncharacterized protein LOC117061050 [Lacerta agilis]|uniref:uncharacterized protein LOC117061050 n=1 Tax=Lacerta agilis TaxID=80427 RepID=UPI001419CEAE|nr:uncharacterized protein LOC117061050 [Lacerta agilis]
MSASTKMRSRKQRQRPTDSPSTRMELRKRYQRMTSNIRNSKCNKAADMGEKAATGYQFLHQEECLFLTEGNEVVKFDVNGISLSRLQQKNDIRWMTTWIHYFRVQGPGRGRFLVTFSQVSDEQNKLLVLTKDIDQKQLKVFSCDMPNKPHTKGKRFDITKLCADDLKCHLFFMDKEKNGEVVQFKCPEDTTHYIHASQTLFLKYRDTDVTDGSIFRFRLSKAVQP